MISRNRSISTPAAMSIERTTSANSTVTCLYSAGVVGVATGAPHSLQNFEFGGSSLPHDPHTSAAAVISRGHATVVPRHYRVTAGQPAWPYRRPQPTGSAHAAPRGVDKPAPEIDVSREPHCAIVECRRRRAETGAGVPESRDSTWPRIPWAAMPSERRVHGHLLRRPGRRVPQRVISSTA